MTAPARLSSSPAAQSVKVVPSGATPVRRPAALTAPPAPVPPLAPLVRNRQVRCVAHRRVQVPTQRGMAVTRRSRLADVVAAATVTVAIVGGLGWIGQDANSGIPVKTVVIRVGGGETLWDVARRVAPQADQGAVVHRIRELNGIAGSAIEPGQRLQVPDGR